MPGIRSPAFYYLESGHHLPDNADRETSYYLGFHQYSQRVGGSEQQPVLLPVALWSTGNQPTTIPSPVSNLIGLTMRAAGTIVIVDDIAPVTERNPGSHLRWSILIWRPGYAGAKPNTNAAGLAGS